MRGGGKEKNPPHKVETVGKDLLGRLILPELWTELCPLKSHMLKP